MTQESGAYAFAPLGAGSQGPAWQLVPKINLLPGKGQQRRSSLVQAGLVIIFLVVALGAGNIFRNLSSIRSETEIVEQQVRNAETRLATQEVLVQDLYEKIGKLDEVREEQSKADAAFAEVFGTRLEWAPPLSAIFASQIPGVQLESIAAVPAETEVEVSGSAPTVQDIVSFQAQLQQVSDIVELRSLEWHERLPEGEPEGGEGAIGEATTEGTATEQGAGEPNVAAEEPATTEPEVLEFSAVIAVKRTPGLSPDNE